MLLWCVIFLVIFAYLVRICTGVFSTVLNQQQIVIHKCYDPKLWLHTRFTQSTVPNTRFNDPLGRVEWLAYKHLSDGGFVHNTANHQENYVVQGTGAHTQGIKSVARREDKKS